MLFRLALPDGQVVLEPTPMDYLPNPGTVIDLDAGTFEISHTPPRIRREKVAWPKDSTPWVTTLMVVRVGSTAPVFVTGMRTDPVQAVAQAGRAGFGTSSTDGVRDNPGQPAPAAPPVAKGGALYAASSETDAKVQKQQQKRGRR